MIVTVPRVAQRIHVKDNFVDDVYNFGRDNVYPQQMELYMKSSGICSSAVNKFADFIFGDGFMDETLENIVIDGKGTTLIRLLESLSKQKATNDTFCLHLNYNALLEISEARIVPVSFVRIGSPEKTVKGNNRKEEKAPNDKKDMFAVWNNWAGESPQLFRDRTDIIWIDKFTTDEEEIKEQIERAGGFDEWNGQLLYINNEVTNTYAPVTFDPVREDVITDSRFATYRKNNVTSGFSASAIIKYNGLVESEKERQEIIKQLQSYQGDENAGNLLILFKTESEGDSEDALQVEQLQQTNIDGLYLNQEKSVNSRIIGNYNQPRALHTFFDDSGIYNVDLLTTAWAYYNEQTKKQRKEVKNLLTRLFTNWHSEELKGRDFTIKPQQFNVELQTIEQTETQTETQPQPKTSEDGQPLPDTPIDEPTSGGTEAQEKLRGSVGGVTGILALVAQFNEGGLTEGSAIELLVQLFGFDESAAREILGV